MRAVSGVGTGGAAAGCASGLVNGLSALLKAGELSESDDVREVLHRQVNRFVAEGLADATPSKPFHGGARPDLADLDVYGVFQSVRGHRVYDDLLRSTKIGDWMAKVDEATKKPKYQLQTTA